MLAVILGCTVAVASSAVQSLGIALQRKSHLLPHHHQHQRMWLAGFLLFIGANVFGSLIQITTLPLIILSPLQSIGLIFNSVLSCLMLGERFTPKLAIGTLIIAVGAFIIAFEGALLPPPPLARFEQVLAQLLRPAFLGWFAATFVVVAALLGANRVLARQRRRPLLCGMRALRRALRFQFARGVNYGIVLGTLTAHTFLFAKSLVDVVVAAIASRGLRHLFAAANAAPWVLLAAMLAIIAGQLTAFNLGLSQILTSILYPLCFLVYNVVNLVNDLCFNSLLASGAISYAQLAWVVLGLSGVLFGVVLLSWDSAFEAERAGSAEEILMQLKFPYEQPRRLYRDEPPARPYRDEPEAASSERREPPRSSLRSPPPRPSRRIISHEQHELLAAMT